MSINLRSGQRYKITNEQQKFAIDLSAADHKSILGHTFHGGENQLWVTEKQVNGQWTIRSVEHQKYLGIETSTPDNGTHLVGLDQPQFWDIEILPDYNEPSKPRVKLCHWVRGACFVADYHYGGGSGINLQLWVYLKGKNQVWMLEEYSSWFSHQGTSIKSGQRYKIINKQNNLVIDLSRANNRSIIACDFHGRENQQWVTEKQANGQWTIRSVAGAGNQKYYLCVERTPDNGTHLVCLDQPQSWDIEILPEPTKPSVKLCQWVRGICFVADCPIDGGAGNNLQMWTVCEGRNQAWVLEEYSSWFSHRGTSIKSGQLYKITNEKNRLVVDLFNNSITVHEFHGGVNQQWVLEKQVNGQWTIRSVFADGGCRKYLCVEKTPDNGTHIVGLDQPQFWDIEILPDPTKPSVKLCQWAHGTCFVADYPKDGGDGTSIQLWTACEGRNQVWVLEEYS